MTSNIIIIQPRSTVLVLALILSAHLPIQAYLTLDHLMSDFMLKAATILGYRLLKYVLFHKMMPNRSRRLQFHYKLCQPVSNPEQQDTGQTHYCAAIKAT